MDFDGLYINRYWADQCKANRYSSSICYCVIIRLISGKQQRWQLRHKLNNRVWPSLVLYIKRFMYTCMGYYISDRQKKAYFIIVYMRQIIYMIETIRLNFNTIWIIKLHSLNSVWLNCVFDRLGLRYLLFSLVLKQDSTYKQYSVILNVSFSNAAKDNNANF